MGCMSSTENSGGSSSSKGDALSSQYQVLKTLGKGGSCEVVKAKGLEGGKFPGQLVAVKKMQKPGPRGINKKLYSQEVDILDKLSKKKHKNIIQLLDNFDDSSFYYIVTVLATGGELFDRIADQNTYGPFTEQRAAKLVRTMLHCLEHIHSLNIVHRDIKPENFVFDSHDPNSEMILIDFGCALQVDPEAEYKDLVGTPYYLAPESAAKRFSNRTGKILMKSDLWAVGVIAYIMMTGTPPFKGHRHADILAEILTKPVTFKKGLKLTDGFKDFVRKCLKKPANRRMGVQEALQHNWCTGVSAGTATVHKEVLKCLKQYNYQTKLKKSVAQLLANNMGEEPRAKIHKHFEELDHSSDDQLDVGELTELLQKIDPTSSKENSRNEAKRMIEEADVDGNRTIGFEEFATIWQRRLLSVNDKYIRAVFKVLDSDDSGHIEVDELAEVFAQDPDLLQAMMKEVDLNNDGKISYDEFQRAMKEEIPENMTNMAVSGNKLNAHDRPDLEMKDV